MELFIVNFLAKNVKQTLLEKYNAMTRVLVEYTKEENRYSDMTKFCRKWPKKAR